MTIFCIWTSKRSSVMKKEKTKRGFKDFLFYFVSEIALQSLFLSLIFFPLVIWYTIAKETEKQKKN